MPKFSNTFSVFSVLNIYYKNIVLQFYSIVKEYNILKVIQTFTMVVAGQTAQDFL